VIVEYEKLRDGIGMATLEIGDRISATAVRKLACDAEIIPVVMCKDGVILDVGRGSRVVPRGPGTHSWSGPLLLLPWAADAPRSPATPTTSSSGSTAA
jgi:hypothetical protein